MAKTLILTVQNQPGNQPFSGRQFNVVLIQKGDRYGYNDCLVHQEDEPMVEFYDARYAGKPEYDPYGQFVTRYYVKTLLTDRTPERGLDLLGHEPVWKVDGMAMEKVLTELGRRFGA
jgi:hypothetical protein